MIFCSLMIYQILQKYLHYPVIVTFSMQEVHMNQIPFPAVTICPRTKISQDYFNVTDAIIKKVNGTGFEGEVERMHNIASTVCDFYTTNGSNTNTNSDDVYNFLNESKTDIFEYCSYTGQDFDCSIPFTTILTDEGVCYSFNILDREDIFRDKLYNFPGYHRIPLETDWDIENGYSDFVAAYPVRAIRPGAKNGLFVVLKTKRSDIEYDCSSDDSGFRVALHLPSKIPEVTESYFTIPFNQRVTGQITPKLIKTSEGVKAFDPVKRDCYFQSEKSLEFFKLYTQENCLIECRTKFVLEACGCVDFYMPRYNDTPVCILESINCIENVEVNFTLININLPAFRNIGKGKTVNCDCLPSCTDLSYSLEISQNSFKYKPRDINLQLDERNKWYQGHSNLASKDQRSWASSIENRKGTSLVEWANEDYYIILNDEKIPTCERNKYEYSIMNLYFKKNHIETKERNELYGFSDFISNFGGLLGLFTGFSMLSFIEIIYFLSLRIWSNIKLFGKWSGKYDN